MSSMPFARLAVCWQSDGKILGMDLNGIFRRVQSETAKNIKTKKTKVRTENGNDTAQLQATTQNCPPPMWIC